MPEAAGNHARTICAPTTFAPAICANTIFANATSAHPTRASALIRWLTAFGLCLTIGIVAVGSIVLLGLRQDTWRQASVASENLATALADNIARDLATYDLSLQGARDAVSTDGIGDVLPQLRHIAIFDRAASAEFLGSLMVVGPDGKVTDSSTSLTPPTFDLSDRDYVRVQRERNDAGLFISAPYLSRLRPGDPSFSISRRITRPDGSFGGAVVGSLRLAYFRAMFDMIDVGVNGRIVVMNRDGQVIARHPAAGLVPIGRDGAMAPVMDRIGSAESGQFTIPYGVDGVERLVSFRQIGPTPLVLIFGTSLADVYAPWWRKALALGSMLGLLALGNLGLCVLFRREMIRRLAAEAALTVAAQELSVIASTDALTGVANRRAFDAALDRAMRPASRMQGPLAMLMLDADCFKLFNDTFGHPAGDEVLQNIAASIELSIRRPNDFVARYGGEEFAALLPDTETDGAMVIAERIREGVAALRIANPGSPTGMLSVSVGVAVLYPQPGQGHEVLVAQADAALFNAKRAGRNRVVLHAMTADELGPLNPLPDYAPHGIRRPAAHGGV